MTNVVEKYGWANSNGPESCGYITPKIVTILKRLNARRVCDLGSGNGLLVSVLRDAGFKVAGIEYDREGFEISKRNYTGINFYNLGVQDDPKLVLDEEGEVFDLVVSTEVIEHLFSPHLLPIFAREVLCEGGFLVISTPYHGYLKNIALSIFNGWDKHHTALWHGGHIKFWSKKTLTRLLADNGFVVQEFHGVGRFPWLWKSMILVAKAV
jgi:2-polyprenyl-3-methyl-5-hydroxy-6-metoxy-1,4-benzoquinol methylase